METFSWTNFFVRKSQIISQDVFTPVQAGHEKAMESIVKIYNIKTDI